MFYNLGIRETAEFPFHQQRSKHVLNQSTGESNIKRYYQAHPSIGEASVSGFLARRRARNIRRREGRHRCMAHRYAK